MNKQQKNIYKTYTASIVRDDMFVWGLVGSADIPSVMLFWFGFYILVLSPNVRAGYGGLWDAGYSL